MKKHLSILVMYLCFMPIIAIANDAIDIKADFNFFFKNTNNDLHETQYLTIANVCLQRNININDETDIGAIIKIGTVAEYIYPFGFIYMNHTLGKLEIGAIEPLSNIFINAYNHAKSHVYSILLQNDKLINTLALNNAKINGISYTSPNDLLEMKYVNFNNDHMFLLAVRMNKEISDHLAWSQSFITEFPSQLNLHEFLQQTYVVGSGTIISYGPYSLTYTGKASFGNINGMLQKTLFNNFVIAYTQREVGISVQYYSREIDGNISKTDKCLSLSSDYTLSQYFKSFIEIGVANYGPGQSQYMLLGFKISN